MAPKRKQTVSEHLQRRVKPRKDESDDEADLYDSQDDTPPSEASNSAGSQSDVGSNSDEDVATDSDAVHPC